MQMQCLLRGFCGGQLHSWAVCHFGIARALKKMGHQVDLFSTDGTKFLPDDLKENLIGYTQLNDSKVVGSLPSKTYDLSLSYTAMKNFQMNISQSARNRVGLWVFEWSGKNVLPTGWSKCYKYCDFIACPSNFGKQIFLDSGVPEQNVKVIPHGVGNSYFNDTDTIPLPTKKKVRLLVVLAQNHLRKNIDGMLDAFGKAFTSKDDVCLILKAKDKPIQQPFDVSLKDCLANFYRKYPQHAELILFNDFLPDMSSLYRSVEIVYSLANCEGFYFPGLEAAASGVLNVAPRWSGQLDFLNDTNALLVGGKPVRANPKSLYWSANPNAVWFNPSIDDAVEKLRYAYHNYEEYNAKIAMQRQELQKIYSWDAVAAQILSYCK
jgi:O-antigen biosynthesis alpha-1,2-mannosyltransferase